MNLTSPITGLNIPAAWETRLNAAIEAADAAGQIQMAGFGQAHQVSTKATAIDLVTEIDQQSDAAIVAILQQRCPDDWILSEEQFTEGDSVDLSRTWVIDPLDGTTNYAHGFPQFASSIAYFQQGKPVLGVVYDPFKQERFVAIQGSGAFLNGQRLKTSRDRVQNLSHALLATGFPYDIATSEVTNLDHFRQVAPHCQGVRRPGAAALDLAYVAAGRLDGFWELKLSIWDVAAGILLVQEAGGQVSNLTGQALNLTERRIHLIASNGTPLHGDLQSLLS